MFKAIIIIIIPKEIGCEINVTMFIKIELTKIKINLSIFI